MHRKAHPLFLICNTPTHVGSGSDLGIVDLPIQRERHTGFPKFEASSLKGSLREAFERNINSGTFSSAEAPDTMIHRLFGYDDGSLNEGQKKELKKYFKNGKGDDQISFAGALGFTDARLLLFPVKSMKGVFAWITCFRALKQFESDMQLEDSSFQLTGLNEDFLQSNETYLFAPDSNLKVGDNILLEEYTFKIANELNGVVQVDQNGSKMNFPDWLAQNLFGDNGSYWSEKIKKDIVVLPDDDFKDFVNLSTEVITRTKIDNTTGTVASGALFNEEYLPSESIMYALALVAPEFRAKPEKDGGLEPLVYDEVNKFFSTNLPNPIQIGGNATLGKGIVTVKLLNTMNHE
ncbi:MAG: type III-B CRISPR module RAMP protein Cmr4 [Lewinellaceae bacterium]|nr:type III-B CRISPR module RAMP protein Cmr4 [Lewinellaceae bacterium]